MFLPQRGRLLQSWQLGLLAMLWLMKSRVGAGPIGVTDMALIGLTPRTVGAGALTTGEVVSVTITLAIERR